MRKLSRRSRISQWCLFEGILVREQIKKQVLIIYYCEEIEAEMLKFYTSLSEKDKRRYAAIEAKKIGHGGIKYISELFGCHRNTITEGKNEIKNIESEKFNNQGIRKKGGGRKSCFEQIPELDEAFLRVVQEHTAGDRNRPRLRRRT